MLLETGGQISLQSPPEFSLSRHNACLSCPARPPVKENNCHICQFKAYTLLLTDVLHITTHMHAYTCIHVRSWIKNTRISLHIDFTYTEFKMLCALTSSFSPNRTRYSASWSLTNQASRSFLTLESKTSTTKQASFNCLWFEGPYCMKKITVSTCRNNINEQFSLS